MFELNGDTRIHALIGDPMGQVLAPALLTRKLTEEGHNAILIPVNVTSENLREVILGLKGVRNLDSVLITLPHKVTTVEFCNGLSQQAQVLGAINAMRRGADGTWYGDNFDGAGFTEGLRQNGFDVAGKVVAIAGAGGAGLSIAASLLGAGARSLTIFDLNSGILARSTTVLRHSFADRLASWTGDFSDADLIVNATSLGLKADDPLPIDLTSAKPSALVADVVTKPADTKILLEAKRLGLKTHDGTRMLEGQLDLLFGFMLGR